MFSLNIKEEIQQGCGKEFLLRLVVKDNCQRVWLRHFSFTNGNFFAVFNSIQFWGR